MAIQLGDTVKDRITGFTGVAVSATEFLAGCRRVAVQPRVGKDGKVPELQVFDEPMLDVVKKAAESAKPTAGMGAG